MLNMAVVKVITGISKIKPHPFKWYEDVEIELHVFLASALDQVRGEARALPLETWEKNRWWVLLSVHIDVNVFDIVTGLYIDSYRYKYADYSVVNLWCPT
jgi:hypothetical protein